MENKKVMKEKKVVIRGEKIGENYPWVARITGKDSKYGLKREFVKGIRDYSFANSKGTRGVETVWELEDGLYEASLPQSWKNTKRAFFFVKNGNMEEIESEKVLDMIK